MNQGHFSVSKRCWSLSPYRVYVTLLYTFHHMICDGLGNEEVTPTAYVFEWPRSASQVRVPKGSQVRVLSYAFFSLCGTSKAQSWFQSGLGPTTTRAHTQKNFFREFVWSSPPSHTTPSPFDFYRKILYIIHNTPKHLQKSRIQKSTQYTIEFSTWRLFSLWKKNLEQKSELCLT